MDYAVELYLDKNTEKGIARLTECLPKGTTDTNSGQGKKTPHVTLGIFKDIDEVKGEEKLKRLVRQWRRGDAYFVTAGFDSDGMIFIAPVINDFIYGTHMELHESFRFSIDGYERYSFGKWVPHLALGRYSKDEEIILVALKEVLRNFTPIRGTFEKVALVQLGDKPREVASFKLRD